MTRAHAQYPRQVPAHVRYIRSSYGRTHVRYAHMKYLKMIGHRGGELKRLPKAGCNWCQNGLDPEPPDKVCQDCHKRFKNMLASRQWNKGSRLVQLSKQPLCEDCLLQKRETPANTVDHVKSWATMPSLFWEEANHRSNCSACHNRKTIKTDGGRFPGRS